MTTFKFERQPDGYLVNDRRRLMHDQGIGKVRKHRTGWAAIARDGHPTNIRGEREPDSEPSTYPTRVGAAEALVLALTDPREDPGE